MQQIRRTFTVSCALLLVCSSISVAADKDAAQQLLTKSFQQATLWRGSPVRLTATFTVPMAGKSPAALQYSLSWAGPDKWRSEWSGEGYSKVTVVRDGARYIHSSATSTPARVLLLEQALGALDGFSPLGPFPPPLHIAGGEFSADKKKIEGMQVLCVTPEHVLGSYCIDQSTGLAVRSDAEYAYFFYGDYLSIGDLRYPQSIRVELLNRQSEAPKTIADGKVEIEFAKIFSEDTFSSPSDAHTSPYPYCTDIADNSAAPSLVKFGGGGFPDAAIKKHETGVVRIYLKLNEVGTLIQSGIYGSAGTELDQASLNNVRTGKYNPYLRCGKGVEVEGITSFDYTLSKPMY